MNVCATDNLIINIFIIELHLSSFKLSKNVIDNVNSKFKFINLNEIWKIKSVELTNYLDT